MGETLRYQELSPVEVVVEEEEEDMEEEGVAMEVDAVEAATEVEDMVEVCIALLGVFQGSKSAGNGAIVLSVTIHWLREKNEEIKVLPFASVRKTSVLLRVLK